MNKKLEEIADYYLGPYKNDIRQSSPALLGGRGGVLIFQTLLYKITKNELFKKEIEENVNYLIDRIETRPSLLAPTHAVGLAGTGCLLLYLSKERMIDADMDEFLVDVDEYLVEELDKFLVDKYYDLMHGAMGVGLYFIKRGNVKQVEKLIEALDENKRVFNDGFAWTRFDKVYTQSDIFDFSLAHGNASMLYFFSQCHKNGIMVEKCKYLIDGLLKFLFDNAQEFKSIGSIFPNHIKADDYGTKTFKQTYSRLAWCYGDLGILYTVLATTRQLGITKYNDKISTYLHWLAKRRAYEVTGVTDAGFCHGSSGVVYVWQKIYELTKEEEFKEVSEFWLNETYNLASREEGLAGYQFYMGATGWQNMSDILTGLAGVGMTILAATEQYEYDEWDQCFYLDY